MSLKLATLVPQKAALQAKQSGESLMSWETIIRNLALCVPEVVWPLLIVPSGDVEKGV